MLTEQALPIDPDETRLQNTLDAQAVQELPELNRNLWDIMTFTPVWWVWAHVPLVPLPVAALTISERKRRKSVRTAAAIRGTPFLSMV